MADKTASRPQPVLYAQFTTVGAAALGLLVAFGLRLTDEQQKAILAAVSALVPLIAMAAAAWARRKVTPLADPRDDRGRRLVVAPDQDSSTHGAGGSSGGLTAEPPVIAPPSAPHPHAPLLDPPPPAVPPVTPPLGEAKRNPRRRGGHF